MTTPLTPTAQTIGFLNAPDSTTEARQMFDEDTAELGYVMAATRLWAYQPHAVIALFDLARQITAEQTLTVRQRSVLVTACASALGDSYCALVWGNRLAERSTPDTAAGVLRGVDDGLTSDERALAAWARTVARTPNGATLADVERLRAAGFSDPQIFAITAFVALRLAFSTVNDALGLRPDAALRTTTPTVVRDAVTFGRPIDDERL
jgi:uncharacterized peroxidase-related enzyme